MSTHRFSYGMLYTWIAFWMERSYHTPYAELGQYQIIDTV